MIMSSDHLNRRLVLIVFASFTIFAAAVVLRLGIGATPYDTTDSAGRRMGFNDPLGAEHYAIIIRNFDPTDLFRLEYAYEWGLFAVHIAGAALLLSNSRVSARLLRWFFAGQALLFPLGFPALLLLPFIVAGCVAGRMDREGFTDIPFIWAVAHPIWLITSLFVMFSLRRRVCPQAQCAQRGALTTSRSITTGTKQINRRSVTASLLFAHS